MTYSKRGVTQHRLRVATIRGWRKSTVDELPETLVREDGSEWVRKDGAMVVEVHRSEEDPERWVVVGYTPRTGDSKGFAVKPTREQAEAMAKALMRKWTSPPKL